MTALADDIAARVRRWYEENRETWWDRVGADEGQRAMADAFMLSLIAEVHRATAELTPQTQKLEPVVWDDLELPIRGKPIAGPAVDRLGHELKSMGVTPKSRVKRKPRPLLTSRVK